MISFCGEITYETKDSSVGSDICFNCQGHQPFEPITQEHREFLHKCLDEWLDKSSGTGSFWLGNPCPDKKEML